MTTSGCRKKKASVGIDLNSIPGKFGLGGLALTTELFPTDAE